MIIKTLKKYILKIIGAIGAFTASLCLIAAIAISPTANPPLNGKSISEIFFIFFPYIFIIMILMGISIFAVIYCFKTVDKLIEEMNDSYL